MLVSLLFLNALVNRRQVLSRHYHNAMHMMIILLTVENPRDGGACWASVYGVAQSDTTEATLQQQQQLLVCEMSAVR